MGSRLEDDPASRIEEGGRQLPSVISARPWLHIAYYMRFPNPGKSWPPNAPPGKLEVAVAPSQTPARPRVTSKTGSFLCNLRELFALWPKLAQRRTLSALVCPSHGVARPLIVTTPDEYRCMLLSVRAPRKQETRTGSLEDIYGPIKGELQLFPIRTPMRLLCPESHLGGSA